LGIYLKKKSSGIWHTGKCYFTKKALCISHLLMMDALNFTEVYSSGKSVFNMSAFWTR